MNDHSLPDDELVSAYLDGEATAAERARVEADPRLRARVDAFGAVAEAVSAPVAAPSAADRERLVAAALAAADAGAPSGAPERDGGATAVPPAAQLADRRRARSRWWGAPPALAAAVLVVLALVGAGLIISGRSSSNQDTAAKAGMDPTDASRETDGEDAHSGTGGGSDPGSSNEGLPGAAPTTTTNGDVSASPPLPELGSFATQAALTRVLATVDLTTLLPPDGTGDPPSEREARTAAATVDRCDQAIRAVPGQSLGSRLAVAAATLAGRRVLVFSHPDRDAPASAPITYLTVADVETCQIRFAVQR